ncbi:MAG: hypothetical protein WCF85_16715 [Rhodospirillaceae bacterium]
MAAWDGESASMTVGKAAKSGQWTDKIKGVVQGKTFRFDPPPPKLDCLTDPLILGALPVSHFPQEPLNSQMRRIFAGSDSGHRNRGQRMLWRFHDTVEAVLTAVWPGFKPVRSLLRYGVSRKAQPAVDRLIRHPYQLKEVIELLIDLPEEYAAHRLYLNELLTTLLKTYRTEIGKKTIGLLEFYKEAHDYFISGYKIEKQFAGYTNGEERFSASQLIYDNYSHGKNYYIYSILCGEELPVDNQIFMFFCNAMFFNARVGWNGELTELPSAKALPSRQRMLFYALRDRSVLRQFKRNPDYAKQLRAILRTFPEDTSASPAGQTARAKEQATTHLKKPVRRKRWFGFAGIKKS